MTTKLKEIAAQIDFIGAENVAVTNIDFVIREARRRGIRELELDEHDMQTAAYYVTANCGQTEWGAEVTRTGKVDMLFGVKLSKL